MTIGEGDVAVVEGAVREEGLATDRGVVNGVGGDRGGIKEVGSVLRERVANVSSGADLVQRRSLSNGGCGRSGQNGVAHVLTTTGLAGKRSG